MPNYMDTTSAQAFVQARGYAQFAMGKNKRKRTPKTILKLPDLEQSKSAVLNSPPSVSS